MSEILKTEGNLRVLLVDDEDPSRPYNDGSSPILSFSMTMRDGRRHVEQVHGLTSFKVDPDIIEHLAAGQFSDAFETYLKDSHGTSAIQWFGRDNHHGYVSFDTTTWRETVGAPLNSVNTDEFEAWCDGDAYGYIVEELTVWTKQDSTETRETWDELDACWGFYAYEWATTCALEALTTTVTNKQKAVSV